jgi:hypothetical protein
LTVFKHNLEVFIPTDKEFNYKELKKLYKKYKKELEDPRSFKKIIKESFVYSFFYEKKFILCLYFYYINDKLFINAFGTRHNHLKIMECFKHSLTWFTCDIYARSVLKTSILCLLRAGFKKIDTELYKYERK